MTDLSDRLLRFKQRKTARDVDRVLAYLIRSAYRNVGAYRRLYGEAGVNPAEIRSVDDLSRLPIVDKRKLFVDLPIRDRTHARARSARCIQSRTSGSTGFPVDVLMSKAEASYRRLLLFSSWRRLGRLPLALRVADVGSWVRSQSGVQMTRRGVGRVLRISLALPIERQVELLLRYRPHVISGYPSALEILADAFGAPAARLSPRLIAARGEVLHDSARRKIEATFGCIVGDFYNCEEVGNIAWPCPHDPGVFHVNTDACIVEIVDETGDPLPAGREGLILVTNLYNCTMPFVRYALHDRGVLLPSEPLRCTCGSSNPRMGVLSGRDDDVVVLPSGRKVSPRLIATAVDRSFDEVSAENGVERLFRRFQVVQDARDHLTVLMIPGSDRSVAFESIILSTLRRIDPALRCTVRLVDELPLEPSGKFKKVVQAMTAEERDAALRRGT